MFVSKTRLLLKLSFASFVLFAEVRAAADEKPELQTVPFVDVQRYLGKWYEIARLPQVFQPDCTAVTAEYSLNPDGTIKVFNFCRVLDPIAGVPISITGEAVAIDESNAKLEVSFFKGSTPGKYWVIELDPNYQWALVGEPSRKSLFVLSRTAVLNPEILQNILERAVDEHGYDLSKLILTIQAPAAVNQ